MCRMRFLGARRIERVCFLLPGVLPGLLVCVQLVAASVLEVLNVYCKALGEVCDSPGLAFTWFLKTF